MERARRRALQSSLIQDLQAQYSEAPEEFRVMTAFILEFSAQLEYIKSFPDFSLQHYKSIT